SQECHVVLREDRSQGFAIRGAGSGGRSELLIEPVSAPRRIDDDDLARFVGQVQEGVGYLRWQVGEPALVAVEDPVADPDLVAALENVDSLFLLVVYVEGRPAPGRHLDQEEVEGAAGVLSRDFEDQVATRSRLQPQTLA